MRNLLLDEHRERKPGYTPAVSFEVFVNVSHPFSLIKMSLFSVTGLQRKQMMRQL